MISRVEGAKRKAERGDGARAFPFAPVRLLPAAAALVPRGAWLGLLLLPALLPQFPGAAAAATAVYLSDTVSSINPGADDERRLNRLRGSTAASYVKSTMAGPVTPPTTASQLTKTAGGAAMAWYTDPLDAVTISGNVTFNIWAVESHNQANAGLAAELLRVSASGAVLSIISAVAAPADEIGTAMGPMTWTVTPVPTALGNGERLALRVYIDDAGGTMGANRTVTVSLDGPTPAASGDSWFSTVENLAPARPGIGSVTGLTQTEFSGSWTLVDGATGYTLAASVNPGAAPSPVYASFTTSENSALLNSPALSPNTTYYPFVRTNGPGASSSWAAFPVQVTPAYAPSFTDFTGISSYTARFNWAANGNHAATLYHVVMSTAADPLSPFGAPVTSSFTYNTFLSSAGLTANTAYRYRVAAVNHGGVYTAYTPIVSAFTLAGMPAAGSFSEVAEGGITAAWTSGGNPAGTLYRLLVSTAADPLSPGGAAVSQHETYNLSFSTAGLSPNTSYYFRAAGVNGAGMEGTYFSPVSTATLAVGPVFSSFSEETYASMRFAWTDGNPADTRYRVLSSTAPDPLSPAGAAVVSSDTYNLSLSSAGLAPDTRYYFRAAAINRNGVATPYTAAASRATLLRYAPAFTNFSGAAEAALQFNFSANGNVHPGTLFRVLYSTAPDPLLPAGAAVSSSDTYNVSLLAAGLASNTTYYFRAAGVNKDGALTAYTAAAGTATLAAVPSGLNFTETATDKVRLEWAAAGGPGTLYRVLASTAADPLVPSGAAVTSSDTYNLYLSTEGLTFSTEYFFRAGAVNHNGIATAWSAIASTTTLAPGTLAAPLAGALTPHVSSVTASWSLVQGATGYTLAASLSPEDPPASPVALATVGSLASAQLPGLAADTVHYVFVRANGDGVVSAWSKYDPAATLLQYAPVFGSFGAPTAGAVSLSWSGGGNPAGTLYRVLSSTAPDPRAPGGAAVVSSDTYNLSLTSSPLAANTSYYFRIAGVNKAGVTTAYTAPRGTSTLAGQPVFSGFSDTGTGAMTFAWTADGNRPGTLYRVLSSLAPDPLNPGGSPVVSSDTYNLSLSTAGLAPNTTYYFRAAAVNNDGVLSAWTAPQANPTLPQAPSFPGFGAVTDSSADFMWAGNGNPAGTLYRVLASRAPDPLNPGAEAVTSSDTYNLYLSSSGLAVDRAYYFVAAALARDGQPTAYTAAQRARTLARQPLFSSFDGVTASAIGASWTANGNPAGTLYRAAVSAGADPLNPGAEAATLLDSYGLSVSSAGLAADTTYYFRVAAVNGDGVETAYTAAAATATLVGYPPLFSGFSDIQTDAIRVLWTANGNADGTRYRVAVSTAPDPLNPGGARVTYEDTYDLSLSSSGLLTNTRYYFRLAAVNKNGVATAYAAAQSERTLQVVTKLYLLDDVSTANPAGDTGEERRLSAVRGAAAVTYTKDTVTGPVAPPTSATQITKTAGGAPQTWYSMPLDAVTIVSSVTFNIRAYESAVQANATITGVLYRASNSGVILSTVAAAQIPRAELTVTDAAQIWTVQPTPTALNNGDRLALRLYIDDGDAVTMAGNRSVFVTVGGPAGGAEGDSWVQILEKVYPARPASLSVTGVTASQVSASWPLVSETTGYTLAASENFGAEPQPVYSSSETLGTLSATLSVPTLAPNTTYYLFVRSNAPGMSGAWQAHPGTATLLAFAPLSSGFGEVAAGSMLFDWSANGNADPGTLYRVVSSTAADPLNPGGAVAVSSLTYNTFLSTSGLAGDTTYYFRVAGLNHNGVPTAYTAAAATATLLSAPPLFTSFDAIDTGAIRFSWSANGNRYPGTLFRVVSSTAPDPLNPGGALAVSSDTYNLYLASSGLAANTTYYFRVAGVNRNGVSTAYTAAAGTATLAYAPAFGSFTSVSAAALGLDWTSGGNPAGTLYRVLSSTAPDPAAPGGAAVALADTYALALSAAGLAADTTYYFRVAALNHNGAATSYTAPRGTATLLGAAPAFAGFSDVAAGGMRFVFSHNGNAPGTLYRVVSSTAPDPLNPGGAVAVSSLTYNTSLSTAGLAADTTYYFSVAGVNKNGVATAYTAPAGTATLLGFPPLPAGFSGVAETALQFNFTANGNAYPGTLYRVVSSTAPDPLAPGGAAVVSSDTYNLSLARTALAADTTYYYRAAGVNKNGVLTAWTAAAATSTLANVPSGFYATGVTEDFMQLNWSAAGNRDPGTLYRVLTSTAADPLAPAGAAVTSSDTYNLFLSTPGLVPSTAYYFRAAAVNNNGVRTAWSDPPFSAATLSPGAIGSPASGVITDVRVSSIAAAWDFVAGASAGYTLAASLSPDNPPSAVAFSSDTLEGDNSAWLEGLAADTVYYLFARANGQYISGDWLALGPKATLLEFQPAFVSFSGVAANTARFEFSANGNAYPGTRFRVLVSTAADPLLPGAAAFSSSDTYNVSLTTAGLSADTTYYFSAAGVNKDGVLTAYTAVQATATPANIPVFSGFSGVGADALQFNWAHNGNRNPGTRYRVLVSTAADPLNPGAAVVTSSETYNLFLSSAGLAADTTYYFRAAALGVNGLATAYSAPAGTATLAAYPPLFAGFTGVGPAAIQLNWSANGNRDPGTRYRVRVSTAPDPLSPGAAAVTSSDTYNLYLSSAGLTPNATRYFAVAAVNQNGVLTAWTAPAGTATLANLPLSAVSTFSAVTSGGFTAAWNANSNPPGTRYQVQVSTAQNFNAAAAGQTASTAPVSGESYAFSGLLSNRDYYFRVRALNLNGVYSAYAELGSTRTLGLAAPAPLPVTQVSANSMTASWALVAGATGYILAASENSGVAPSPVYASSVTAGASAELSGLALNSTYYLFVKAGGPGDESPWAVYPATSTLANIPTVPATPFGAVTDSGFTLSWEASANPLGSTRYTVQVSTALDFNGGVTNQVVLDTAPAAGPLATFTGLSSDTYYYARVRAEHNNGNSTDWVSLGFVKTLILAELHAAGDGVLVYGQAGNSMPQFRDYHSAANSFSAVRQTVSGAAGALFTVRTNPLTTKQEAVAAYVKSGTLRVLCTDGANWYEEWTQTVGGADATRRFDIAFETNSGDVMVLYSRGVSGTNELGWRTKPGGAACGSANWTAAATLDPVRTSGAVHWVKMAPDRRADHDNIAAIWADSNSDLSAMVWNGAAWENEPAAALETSLEIVAAAQDSESFAVETESLSGDIMVVWGHAAGADGVNGVRYATAAWSGGSPAHAWGGAVSAPAFLDDATNLDLAANPASDEMVFASIGNAGADLQAGYWSGAAWTNTANLDTTAQVPLAGTKLVAAAWISSGTATRSVIVYNDAAATNVGWYVGNGGTFTAQADFAQSPVFANPQRYYDLEQDPVNRDRLVLALADSNSDLFAKRLVMNAAAAFTWTNTEGGAALEPNLGSALAGGYSFVFWPAPPTTTFEQSAYRFFANTDTTDVGAPLAAQDSLAALPAAGAAFRLRTLVNIGQVDLPVSGQDFKLQFAGQGDGTCEAPANGSPAVWTDVGALTAIAFRDNAPADRAPLTANAADPQHGVQASLNQVYAEANGFSNSVSGIARNRDGMWDLALRDNGMLPGAIYCLRLVKGDGVPLEYYPVYPRVVSPAALVLNEVYPSGAAAAADWVELYNNSQSTVPLTGWKVEYVENTIALGGSAGTVWTGQAGQYVNAMSTFLVSGLALDLNAAQGYHVRLLDAAGGLVDRVQWPAGLAPGQSFARVSDGHPDYFEIDPTPTPGYFNSVSTDPYTINEVAYGPLLSEFVELFSSATFSTATLQGYSLRNAASSAAGLVFRFTRKIYPRDYTALDGSSLSADALAYAAVFGAAGLADAGDFLALENSSGSTVNQVTWQSGQAYSRYNYSGQLTPYANPAPAGAVGSIARGPAEGAHSGVDSADFFAAGSPTLASRNNNAGLAAPNTLAYPNPGAGPRYLSRNFPLRLALGEDASGGRGNNIVLSRAGGAADPGSPHIYRLQDIGFDLASLAQQATEQFGLQFYDQDGQAPVAGAYYKFILNSGNGPSSAPQVLIASVAYDASVHSASAAGPAAATLVNDSSRASALRVDLSNNSPAGFNGVEIATVAFSLFREDLFTPLTTAEARALFDAVLLVADSTSTGLSGTYEPAIDVATAAWVPMAAITLNAAGLSTLTVTAAGLDASFVAAGSTRAYYIVLVTTQNASSKTPATFRVRLEPAAGLRLRDASGLLRQDFTPGAQVDTASFTVIAPALPPPATDWPYVSESSSPITGAITSYGEGLLPQARIYLPVTDGTLVSVSTTGALLWSFPTTPLTALTVPPSFPQEEGGSVYLYFAGANGDVYKVRDLGASAAQTWRTPLGSAVKSMMDTDTRLYVAVADNKVHCLNKADGQACASWSFASEITAPVAGLPTVDERASVATAWAGLEDGKVVSLKTGDGTSNTTFVTGGPVKSSPFFDAYVASDDNALYVTSTDGKIYAINSGNMTAMSGWNDYDAGSPIYSSPFLWTLDGTKYVFFGADNGRLYKLDAGTGALVWYFQAGGAIRSSPVLAPAGYMGLVAGEDYVYFGSDDGRIYGVNANTGQLRTGWPVTTGGPVRADPAADMDTRTISVGSADGRLYTIYVGP